MIGRLALVATATLALAHTAAAGVYPTNVCVSTKQKELGGYCKRVLKAAAGFDKTGDAVKRDAALQAAVAKLAEKWTKAEGKSTAKGVDCAQTTLSNSAAQALVDSGAGAIVDAVNAGLDLGTKNDAKCGSTLLVTAATACNSLLKADANFVKAPAKDAKAVKRDALQAKARTKFAEKFAKTLAKGCPTDATASGVQTQLDDIDADVVRNTTVSPNVDDAQFTTIAPTGTTTYEKKALTPKCINGSPYYFFVKRGTVNKLLMYYQGGGACWDALTCGVPVCDANVDPNGGDNPNGGSTGFADRNNPDNPFRDWNVVFVSYCSCDVHFGDAAQDYSDTLHIEHRGFDNARIAEKWAREHFVNPDVVFVTGSSAGAYGAWFHAPLLQFTYPASKFHVLADAGNGVITPDFLQTYFPNWDFRANIPSTIPGVIESIDSGEGIPAYTKAVATYFPETTWAHYTTAFDGGSGGQTGFYNLMLNNNNPLEALTWWEGSCQFNSVMRQQVQATAADLTSLNNYRYYIGTGSRHTMWGSNKVYTDTTGGVPTIVDWVNATLASSPPMANDPGWTDVECTNCGLTLPGDPKPNPLAPPFTQVGSDVVIDCSASASGAFLD